MAEINPPSFMQSEAHPANGLRQMMKAVTGGAEGVLSATDLVVTAQSTPAMAVDVAAGEAWINPDNAQKGTYFVKNDGTVSLSITASDATNARVDLVIAVIKDNELDGGANNFWSIETVVGTPGAGAPTQPANSLLLGTVTVPALASVITVSDVDSSPTVYGRPAVSTAEIEDGAVTSVKLATGVVTADKLGTDSVSSSTIQASAVGSSEIAENAVTASEIASGVVGTDHLAGGAVTDAKIASGIDGSKITTGVIPESQIPTLDGSKIATGTITATQMDSNSVGEAELIPGAVTEFKIASGAVTNAKIEDVDASKINSGTFSSGDYTFPNKLTVTGQINAGAGSGPTPSIYLGDVDTGFNGAAGGGTLNVSMQGVSTYQFNANAYKPLVSGIDLGANSTSQRWDTIYAANTTVSSSDDRLKTRTGDVPGTEFILSLDTFAGRWTDKQEGAENTSHFFLSAQDVATQLTAAGIDVDESYLIHKSDDPEEYLSVAYTEIIPSLIKTIQEMNARIEALEAS